MKNTIVLFGTSTCSWFKKMKDYLNERSLAYKYIDVSKDDKGMQDMLRKSGQMGVPQIWINNNAVVGFDRAKIERLLQN